MRVPAEYRDKPLIGSQVPWKKIEGELLRVVRFVRLCDLNMRSKPDTAWASAEMELYYDEQDGRYTPIARHLDLRRSLYALLVVECPQKLLVPTYMPVRHRFDFFKLCILFDPFGDGKSHYVAPDEEVLLGFPVALEGLGRKVLRPFMPRLHLFIHPKGYLEWFNGFRSGGEDREDPPGGWLWRPRWKREAPSS